MQRITLTLTDMANGGEALGRDEQKRVVFVPFTIPGERIEIELVEDKKRFARGRLVKLLEPSPERVEPKCAYFGRCGGCHFQHMDYHSQLHYKEMVIRDQLKRIGQIDEPNVRPVLPNPDVWRHSQQATFGQSAEGDLGFWAPYENRIIPVESCPIMQEALLKAFQDFEIDFPNLLQLTLRMDAAGGLMAAAVVEDDDPPHITADYPASVTMLLSDGRGVNLMGDSYQEFSLKDRILRVSGSSFFYPSPAGLSILIDQLGKYADLTGTESLWDLYCGVGTLSIFLAPAARSVICVEANPDSVDDAAANLDRFDDVSLYEGSVEVILPMLEGSPDLVIVDPPPSGVAPAVIDELGARASNHLLYVSSDMATFARDSRRLTKSGYILREVQPIDMYPHNYRTLAVSHWQNEE